MLGTSPWTRCHSLAIEFAAALRRVDSAIKVVSPAGWLSCFLFSRHAGCVTTLCEHTPRLPGKKRRGAGIFIGGNHGNLRCNNNYRCSAF